MDTVSGSDLLLNFRTSCCWNSFWEKRENRVLSPYRQEERRVRGCENEIRLVCSKLLLTCQRFCRNGYLCYDTCYISKSHLYIHSKHNLMEFVWHRMFFCIFTKGTVFVWGNPFFIIELNECIFGRIYVYTWRLRRFVCSEMHCVSVKMKIHIKKVWAYFYHKIVIVAGGR